jgi:hypothetical protein
MRYAVAIAALLAAAGTIASAQKTKDVAQSRYVPPKVHKSSSSGPALGLRTTNANTAELAKIEQQNIKSQSRRAKSQNLARLPSPPAQDRNKPMRLAPKPRASNTLTTNTANSGRGVKVH